MGRKKEILPGILFMLASGFSMSLQGLCIRFLNTSASVEVIIAVRFALCFLISLLVSALFHRNEGPLTFHNKWLLFVRSFAAFLALVICYQALEKYSAGLVFILFFSTPIFIPLIARVWLGVKLVPRLFTGLGIALVGMFFIINPGNGTFHLGLLSVLFGAILAGVSTLGVRVLHRTDSIKAINFAYFFIGLLCSLLYVILTGRYQVETLNVHVLLVFLLLGVLAYIFQLFVLQALRYAPSRLLSPFSYSSSLFSFGIEVVFLHMIPSAWNLLGVLLVIFGTGLNVFLFPKNDTLKITKEKNTG